MSGIPRWTVLAFITCCTAALFGACSNKFVKEERIPETGATLEGSVTYGSEKLAAALIIIAGTNGQATGDIDEATGRYRIENVPLGEVRIGVNTDAAKGKMIGKMMSGYYKGPEAKSRGIVAAPRIIAVPAKFANPDTSGITTTIQRGANECAIQIPK